MGKKKKIRDQFDDVFKAGNEKAIKKMLDKHPWLLNEVSKDFDAGMSEQNQVLAVLGVMEDDIGGAVPIDEIVFSLKTDFNTTKLEGDVLNILKNVESLNLVKRESSGWILTPEGSKLCDEYLNKRFENIDL
jgi:hypothetical protein